MVDFSENYARLLDSYLANGAEDALLNAYDLGRDALARDIGLLEITQTHRGAMEEVLRKEGGDLDQLLVWQEKGTGFLNEVLSPFEFSRASNRDANTALRRLFEVLESESKRLAHILHDESAQMLATVYLELSEIARESPEPLARKVNEVVGHLDEVRDQLRRLSHELRPLILDQLGLMPALRFLADGVEKRAGFDIEVSGSLEGRFSQAIETVLYRTVQEALNNVNRHARAKQVEVQVWAKNGKIHCYVDDDGVGFEIPEERRKIFNGLGLIGIQERVAGLNGELTIESTPGEGTSLQVVIPI